MPFKIELPSLQIGHLSIDIWAFDRIDTVLFAALVWGTMFLPLVGYIMMCRLDRIAREFWEAEQ